MAVVVEQKTPVGRSDVNFGLDLWGSVQELHRDDTFPDNIPDTNFVSN